MSFFGSIANRFGYVGREDFEKFKRQIKAEIGTSQRSYGAASFDRLVNDWLSPGTSGDMEDRTAIRTVRNRSRESERNDDYMRRFLKLVENNVLGHGGIGLQLKCEKPDGSLDRDVNDAVEAAWAKWGRKENCTVSKNYTWRGLQRMILRSAKRDAFVLSRTIAPFQNDFLFALQPIEGDQLDVDYNVGIEGENQIRLGTELNQWAEPQAYHIFSYHPGDYTGPLRTRRRIRVPASECLCIKMPDRISQTLAMPDTMAALRSMKMLHGYHEAELIAAREAACKGYAIKKAEPVQFGGETDSQGRTLQDIEPGMGLDLNPGEEYQAIDPQHPVQAFPAFIKSILRGVAGGLGVSYNSLANDLEGVNYSSLRAGLLDEREEWKGVQQWLIEEFCQPTFERWLMHCLQFRLIQVNGRYLTEADFERVNQPCWKPRRWPWVDPQKDMQANILAVEKGFDSRRNIISEEGRDIEEVFKEQKEDKDLADEYELEFPIEGVSKSPGEEGEDLAAAPTSQPVAEPKKEPKPARGNRILGVKRLLAGLHG